MSAQEIHTSEKRSGRFISNIHCEISSMSSEVRGHWERHTSWLDTLTTCLPSAWTRAANTVTKHGIIWWSCERGPHRVRNTSAPSQRPHKPAKWVQRRLHPDPPVCLSPDVSGHLSVRHGRTDLLRLRWRDRPSIQPRQPTFPVHFAPPTLPGRWHRQHGGCQVLTLIKDGPHEREAKTAGRASGVCLQYSS